MIVLARECGLKMELDDLNVQNLVPEELLTMSSVEIFMDNLPKVIIKVRMNCISILIDV